MPSDSAFAAEIAQEAGRALLELRAGFGPIADEAHRRELKDAGDRLAQQILSDRLTAQRPEDAVLSEEATDSEDRLAADRVWIIDPLDGTNEFGEHGRQDWAVHIALWERDRLTAGAVSLPALGLTFATDPAPVLPDQLRSRPRLITSRNRNPYSAVVIAQALDCDAIRLGSAGAKAMAVVVGEADIYVHDGGMYQWDSAAPAAVAAAAGLHVSRIDGSPLVYNERDPWLPDFIICRQQYAQPALDALRADVRLGRNWR